MLMGVIELEVHIPVPTSKEVLQGRKKRLRVSHNDRPDKS